MSLEQYTPWFGIGSLIAVAVAIATYFRGMRTQDDRINKGFAEQDKKMYELQLEMRTTKVQLEVFLHVLNKELPKTLVSRHTPEIDEYMWKRMKGEHIPIEEKEQVYNLMQGIINGQIDIDAGGDSKDYRAAYALQMAAIAAELAKEKEKQKVEQEYSEQKKELEAKLNEKIESRSKNKRKWRMF